MATYMNPFTDVGFKRIFGQEFSKPLLIDFLNNLFSGELHIVDLKFLDKEQLGIFDQDRSLIYDVYCELDTGEKIIVEMQNCKQGNFKSRSIYYICESIARQGEQGMEWNYQIKAVYLIAFLNFTLSDIDTDFRTDVLLMNKRKKQEFSDLLNLIYLQLPYFEKSAEACENNFDRWIYLLKHMETIVKLPWPEKNPVFQRLAEISDLGSLSREERMKYDEAIRKYRDTLCVMQSQLDEGIQIGRDQGIQIGRDQGIQIGIEKGRQQTLAEAQMQIQQNLASVARNLKAQHVPLDVIASSTGLSIQEIENLS